MTDRIIKSGIDRHYLDSSFHDGQDHDGQGHYLDSLFHDGQDHSMMDRIIKSGIERDRHYLDSSFHDGQDHKVMILSVTIWIAHSMTDRIIKSDEPQCPTLLSPVRHYLDSSFLYLESWNELSRIIKP